MQEALLNALLKEINCNDRNCTDYHKACKNARQNLYKHRIIFHYVYSFTLCFLVLVIICDKIGNVLIAYPILHRNLGVDDGKSSGNRVNGIGRLPY